jgi:glycosyltransferase involved in cell wall biosynthesis
MLSDLEALKTADKKPLVRVHFVRNGPSYLPELDAYAQFITAHGHEARIHDTSTTVPDNAHVVWWICGRVPHSEASRLRDAFQIHEYASASVPPYAWLKDQVKHWTQPRPDFRVFQNAWVRERLGFADDVPSNLRDMGVAQHFLDAGQIQAQKQTEEQALGHPLGLPNAPEFDLVYLGEMGRLLPFMPLLQSIHDAGRTLLLVGDVPAPLRTQLPASVSCTGRVPHAEVPRHLLRARFGLNLVSNVAPYHQQTSTKLLEYCAVGLPVVSNDYAWVRDFATHFEGHFYLLNDAPDSWELSFGGALDAFPYRVPDVQALAWPTLLRHLPLWKKLHIDASHLSTQPSPNSPQPPTPLAREGTA